MSAHSFGPYVSVAQRKANAALEMAKRAQGGKQIDPVIIDGRQIAKTFWGAAWCRHIEVLSDFASRLENGKRYARNGSIVHLEITKGKIEAIVNGGELYEITIEIQPIALSAWTAIKEACAGEITSAVELLQGKFSEATMRILTDPESGMFPHADDFDTDCNCADFTRLCKHLAAALYGVGARLDRSPELLFTLRGVDPTELLSSASSFSATRVSSKSRTLNRSDLSDIFGIDLVDDASPLETEIPADTPPLPTNKRRIQKKPAPSSTPLTAKARRDPSSADPRAGTSGRKRK